MNNEEIEKIDTWLEELSKESVAKIFTVSKVLQSISELSDTTLFDVPYETLEKAGLDKESIVRILTKLWRKGLIELMEHTEGNCVSDWKQEREEDNCLTEVTMIDINALSFKYLYQKLNQNKKLDKDQEKSRRPSTQYSIKKLYQLSEHPTAILYDGQKKVTKEWIPTKNKTQPWAILKLAADKYQRNINKQTKKIPHMVKLSLAEIKHHIDNPQNCNQRRSWQGLTTPDKKRLNDFKANICKLVPFTNDELFVEVNPIEYLVFSVNNSTQRN